MQYRMRLGKRSSIGLAILAIAVASVVTVGALSTSWSKNSEAPVNINIAGLVHNPAMLSLDDLKSRESVTVEAELICVSGISSGRHSWTGVRLNVLLSEVGVKEDVIKVAFTASDHYTTDLTLSDAMRDDVVIAYLEDGSPMSEKTRLVVPGKWGYKWISDLTEIELVDYDFLGKWEQRGYPDDATIT